MYMSMKFTSTLTALSMALLVACSSSSSATATKVAVPEPAAVDSNFVTQQGNKLMLNEKNIVLQVLTTTICTTVI